MLPHLPRRWIARRKRLRADFIDQLFHPRPPCLLGAFALGVGAGVASPGSDIARGPLCTNWDRVALGRQGSNRGGVVAVSALTPRPRRTSGLIPAPFLYWFRVGASRRWSARWTFREAT